MRIVCAAMAGVFALGALVQLNDPDPLPWMAVYGAACALSAMAAVRSAPIVPASGVGLVALAWGLWLEAGVYGRVLPGELFETWDMKDDRIEVAREAGGLVLVGVWLLFLAGRSWHARRRTAQRPVAAGSIHHTP